MKPDVSSVDAFNRAMLAARSIAYPDPAGRVASGIYVACLLERLGIAGEMRPKTKLLAPWNLRKLAARRPELVIYRG